MANNLHSAKLSKKDEFYTQLSDIEHELKHYKSHFKDKIVYCNCDDPRVSNFFHYFSYNLWYAFVDEAKYICQFDKMNLIEMTIENDQTDKPIPDNKPDNNTYINTYNNNLKNNKTINETEVNEIYDLYPSRDFINNIRGNLFIKTNKEML